MYEQLKAEQSRMIRSQLMKWCSAVERGDAGEAAFRAREVGVLVQLVVISPRFAKEWQQRSGALASVSPQDLAAGLGTLLTMLAELSAGGHAPSPDISTMPNDGTAAR